MCTMTGKKLSSNEKKKHVCERIVPTITGTSAHGMSCKLSNRNLFKRLSRRVSFVMVGVFFFSVVSASPLYAIGTINASALQLDLERPVSSFTKSSPSADVDTCLPLLRQVRLSSSGSTTGQSQRPAGQKASMPMTLGFLIGVRVALGPKEVVKPGRRVQIGPELLQRYDTGESYALAVANYRRCKSNKALKQR